MSSSLSDTRVKELKALADYEEILTTQQRHYWRQAAVHDVSVIWHWEPGGGAHADITYILNERALASLSEIGSNRPLPEKEELKLQLSNELLPLGDEEGTDHCRISPQQDRQVEISKWIRDVREDLIEREHNSQYPPDKLIGVGYRAVMAPNVAFRIAIGGTDQKALDRKDPYVIYPRQA